MKFILTSNSYQVTKSWIAELDKKPAEMKAAFIDTAADVYNKSEAMWLKADRDALTEVGFLVEDYSLDGKSREQLITDLEKFDLLFVSGGNTFYLLEKANQSGFTDLIKEDYFADKVYVGSSAGSVFLSDNIEVIKFLDNPDQTTLDNFDAAGILNFTIFPHWGSPKFKSKYEQTLSFAYDSMKAFMTLKDSDYLVLFENKLKLVQPKNSSV